MHVHSGSLQHWRPSEVNRVGEIGVELTDPQLVRDEGEEARGGVEVGRHLPPV